MALEGIRVLDLSRLVAGGMVGMLLADFGAEVMEEYTREKPMRVRTDVRYDGVPPRAIGG